MFFVYLNPCKVVTLCGKNLVKENNNFEPIEAVGITHFLPVCK